MMDTIPKYTLIIATDAYAGNFEREMCAYITGAFGDCEVGNEVASEVMEEMPEYVESIGGCIANPADENGTRRPVSGGFNSDGKYNNVEIYFDVIPSKGDMKIVQERIHSYGKGINILSVDFILREIQEYPCLGVIEI